MKEVLKHNFRKPLAVLGLALGAGACSATVGNGFVSGQGECIPYTAEIQLHDGQSFDLSVADLSTNPTDKSRRDMTRITNVGGKSLKLENQLEDDVEISLGKGNRSESEKVVLTFDEETQSHELVLVEGDASVEIVTTPGNDGVIILEMDQICPKP